MLCNCRGYPLYLRFAAVPLLSPSPWAEESFLGFCCGGDGRADFSERCVVTRNEAKSFGNEPKIATKPLQIYTTNSALQSMLLWKPLCGGSFRGLRLFFLGTVGDGSLFGICSGCWLYFSSFRCAHQWGYYRSSATVPDKFVGSLWADNLF